MKDVLKNATSQFSALWSKPKPAPIAPPAKIVHREPGPAERALAKYSGDPAIIAAHIAWGSGRLWPKNEVFEKQASSTFKLPATGILAVLGCGTGGAAIGIARHVSSFVHGYDWRDGAQSIGTDFAKQSDLRTKILIHSINLTTVFAPRKRCDGLIAAEPVLTQAQDKVLDWLRMAVVPDGQVVFEEPSLEPGSSLTSDARWFKNINNKDCFWQSPAERESAFKKAGFGMQRVHETTGIALRELRNALDETTAAQQELDEAIKLVPILEPLQEFFKKEVESAKNRLNALENGNVAVYRYRAIKQRTDG